MDSYDTIFLGYPNWLGTVPMAVLTFLEEYDFSGKTLIPFCTHEGSGMGHSESDIAKNCPDAKILNGFSILGSQVTSSKKDIKKWLDNLGML
ncbi:flavodoxin [Methanococcus maripaludis]|uniref:Flavodoxin n=1 Tax=Methanococcus maripaludis TaxID=39152 RepID=A0A2L1C8B7_METMI|nr:flavodoxin [Methanococcus maripaludis]AVB75611.1 flavodoxin [Methanococcus maripaludis]MBA2863936.1 flavodoxin [Methanococcus maripaludis]MBB6496058.1 flavodoxin [Methanococcus maripaludis]